MFLVIKSAGEAGVLEEKENVVSLVSDLSTNIQ